MPVTDAQSLKQLVLGRKDAQDLSDNEQELPPDLMTVNMGPSHPAMHGTVRIVLTVDGERVVRSDVQPGYLHRCFEKESEHATYTQVFPYTDRLNYVSPMINNVGWAMVAEKLMGIKHDIPKRAEYVRVIVSEMSRITDHLTCCGASAMELGAFGPFLFFLKAREWIYELLEVVSGARLTHTYVRIGGVNKDLPDGFLERLEHTLAKIEKEVLPDVAGLLNSNKIFRDRMAGIGAMTRKTRSRRAAWVRSCAPRASTTTCAKTIRTRSIPRSSSTYRSAPRVTASIDSSCASRRSISRCGSCGSASSRSPRDPR